VTAGCDVIPVPVYYPEVIEILGKQVYRRLTEIPGNIDLVDVFRRSQDIDGHVEEILAKMQLPFGFNRASVTISLPRRWRRRASKLCKIVA
jgi:predicted CoA-binding protein